MIALQKRADELEAMVDASCLREVIEALALVCSSKADHLRENWQDENAAKDWDDMADILIKAECKAERIFKHR